MLGIRWPLSWFLSVHWQELQKSVLQELLVGVPRTCFWQDFSLPQHILPYLQYLCNLFRSLIPLFCGHPVKPCLPSQSLSLRLSSRLAEYFLPSPYCPRTSKSLLLCALELIVLTKSPVSSLSSLHILFSFLHYPLTPNRDTVSPVLEGSSSWLTITPFYTTCIQFLVILPSHIC